MLLLRGLGARPPASSVGCRVLLRGLGSGPAAPGGGGKRRRRRRSGRSGAAKPEELPKVAVVGRPNVGKSALCNRLAASAGGRGRRERALVHAQPHVTRDWRPLPARVGDLAFAVVDTPGLGPGVPEEATARELTAQLLPACAAALLVVDGRAGVAEGDRAAAEWLRAQRAAAGPAILVANKMEGASDERVALLDAECAALGLGAPVCVSAAHGEGLAGLHGALAPAVDAWHREREAEDAGADGAAAAGDGAPAAAGVKVAIIGRPNVGKSTLLNALLGRERALTGPTPGLTRDPVQEVLRHAGRAVTLVDTAGFIRRPKYAVYDESGGEVTKGSMAGQGRSVAAAHVVLLVVDARVAAAAVSPRGAFTHQEASLADRAVRHGCALVVLANKVDALSAAERRRAERHIQAAAELIAPQVGGAACMPISARSGTGVGRVLPAVLAAHRRWATQLPTSLLNTWFQREVRRGAAGEGGGVAHELRRVKFLAQVKAAPPAFRVALQGAGDLSDACKRFLRRALRERFDLAGVPLALFTQAGGRAGPDRRRG